MLASSVVWCASFVRLYQRSFFSGAYFRLESSKKLFSSRYGNQSNKMSSVRGSFVKRTISKWTATSFTNYPSQQCYLIIHRYLHSDTLFNEINSSFHKLKEQRKSQPAAPSRSSPSSSSATKDTMSVKVHASNQKKKNNNNQHNPLLSPAPLTKHAKSSSNSLSKQSKKKRKNKELSRRTQLIESNTILPSKSIFDKYEMIAAELQQQTRELQHNELMHEQFQPSKYRKENIDHYIRKEFERKQKQKRQRFQDPLETELDYYDMSLPDLVSKENIVKQKPTPNKLDKYDEKDQQLIQSELNLPSDLSPYSETDEVALLDDTHDEDEDDNLTLGHGYDDMFNALTPNDSNKREEQQLMKQIDWTKLANYVELNGWNNFAEFLNEQNDETAIQKYTIPSFLSEIPKRRKSLDRPKAQILGTEEAAFQLYRINERVQFEPFKYLTNGNMAVLINDKHYGFIKRHNLPIDVKIGEYHTGYVYDINHYGKIEVIMEKPNFWSRMAECQRRIIGVLRYCNGTVEISDKADAKLIRSMFQMSKKNFKRALGMLLKNKVVEIFNERDDDIPNKIVLSNVKIDMHRYDVGKEVEKAMWKSKPIWEYGVSAPPFDDIVPDEMKERRKKSKEQLQQKYTLRKKKG